MYHWDECVYVGGVGIKREDNVHLHKDKQCFMRLLKKQWAAALLSIKCG